MIIDLVSNLEILLLVGAFFGCYVPGMMVLLNWISSSWPKVVSILFLLIHSKGVTIACAFYFRTFNLWSALFPIPDLMRFQSTYNTYILPWLIIGAIGVIALTKTNCLNLSMPQFQRLSLMLKQSKLSMQLSQTPYLEINKRIRTMSQ